MVLLSHQCRGSCGRYDPSSGLRLRISGFCVGLGAGFWTSGVYGSGARILQFSLILFRAARNLVMKVVGSEREMTG